VVVGDVYSPGRVLLPLLLLVGLQVAHYFVETDAPLALLVLVLFIALHHVKEILVYCGIFAHFGVLSIYFEIGLSPRIRKYFIDATAHDIAVSILRVLLIAW